MKRFALALAAVGALALFTTNSAQASDRYSWGHRSYGGYHHNLRHRAYRRAAIHHDAHHYPMTWGQHDRLHDNLEHDAYHDRLEHRVSHRYYQPSGFSYHGRGFGFRIRF